MKQEDIPSLSSPQNELNKSTPAATTPVSPTTSVTNTSAWRRRFFILLTIALGVLGAGIGASSVWYFSQNNQNVSLQQGIDGNSSATTEEKTIAAVAEKVSPSVVSIVGATEVRSMYGTMPTESAGTGIIISKDGYIMTNNHVIEDVSEVSIVDSDGDTFSNVKIIGRDPLNDIAFLKITSDKTFTPIEIGDSSTVRIGQQVVAIGNALGQYKNTVTSGVLSGTGRPITAQSGDGSTESLVDLLQTDTSINSGNSGGPLLNLSGQVIGINTAVASNANGIGFAIPINATKGIIASVLESGTIERPFLGINYLSIVPEIAKEYDLPVKTGAYIYTRQGSAIASNGPAARAGIKDGDIIQKVNNYIVGENGGLSSILGQFRPGDTITVTVLRDGKTQDIKITLGDYPSANQ